MVTRHVDQVAIVGVVLLGWCYGAAAVDWSANPDPWTTVNLSTEELLPGESVTMTAQNSRDYDTWSSGSHGGISADNVAAHLWTVGGGIPDSTTGSSITIEATNWDSEDGSEASKFVGGAVVIDDGRSTSDPRHDSVTIFGPYAGLGGAYKAVPNGGNITFNSHNTSLHISDKFDMQVKISPEPILGSIFDFQGLQIEEEVIFLGATCSFTQEEEDSLPGGEMATFTVGGNNMLETDEHGLSPIKEPYQSKCSDGDGVMFGQRMKIVTNDFNQFMDPGTFNWGINSLVFKFADTGGSTLSVFCTKNGVVGTGDEQYVN